MDKICTPTVELQIWENHLVKTTYICINYLLWGCFIDLCGGQGHALAAGRSVLLHENDRKIHSRNTSTTTGEILYRPFFLFFIQQLWRNCKFTTKSLTVWIVYTPYDINITIFNSCVDCATPKESWVTCFNFYNF